MPPLKKIFALTPGLTVQRPQQTIPNPNEVLSNIEQIKRIAAQLGATKLIEPAILSKRASESPNESPRSSGRLIPARSAQRQDLSCARSVGVSSERKCAALARTHRNGGAALSIRGGVQADDILRQQLVKEMRQRQSNDRRLKEGHGQLHKRKRGQTTGARRALINMGTSVIRPSAPTKHWPPQSEPLSACPSAAACELE